MITHSRYIDFFTLKNAYRDVRHFLETETYEKAFSLKTKLVRDMYITGDDNYDLLQKFVTKYKLDTKGFDYQRHFHTEYELFGSEQAFYNLIKLLISLMLTCVQILTFGKIKPDLAKLNILDAQRQVSDMTVGDMVVWYLEKEFITRKDIRYVLYNNR